MSDALARTRGVRPRLIDGIYNYCDSRCARCTFSARCLSYLFQTYLLRAGPAEPEWNVPDIAEIPTGGQPREVEELIAEVEARAPSMTPDERAVLDRAHEEHVRTLGEDRLVVAARGYAMSTWNVAHALESLVRDRGDPVVIEAVDSVSELAGPIASKVSRAVSASLRGDGFDLEDADHDADGSAKVARLAIEESRLAWRVLAEGDRSTADGVPTAMLRVLDEIDAQLAARFPMAMAFVRPGFDTDDPP